MSVSFKKTAKLDLTGGSGWDAEFVARWLKTYANDMIPEYTKIWMRNLGRKTKSVADAAYATTVKYDAYHPLQIPRVTTQATKNGLTVTAFGPEVAFCEFGAGYYADAGMNELSTGTMQNGFIVAPGEWSMGPEGKEHFLETDAATPPGPVPLIAWKYNVKPGRGLNEAWNAIKQAYQAMGLAAFNGIDITKSVY